MNKSHEQLNEKYLLILLSTGICSILYGLIISSMLFIGIGAGVMLLCVSLLPQFEGKSTPISDKIVNWKWSK